ncbi:hypothetical protein C8R43DRAFT_873087 [Mycena crocata]|nr:hypothetical protein C8R43DRAFT_873087 [Mycena crocata]
MSTDIRPIIFYDIPSTEPGCAWTPSSWRIRYTLNFKGLPYKTEWVQFHAIAALYSAIGATPSQTESPADSTPSYALPVIRDPNTGVISANSALIAGYLDSAYPDTPCVLPEGVRDVQHGFRVWFEDAVAALSPHIFPMAALILTPRSAEYYMRTKEAEASKKLTDLPPQGVEAWKALEAGFGTICEWMKESGPFVLGEEVSFADFIIGAELQWFRMMLGEESEKWRDMMGWHGGRWERLLQKLQPYEGAEQEAPPVNADEEDFDVGVQGTPVTEILQSLPVAPELLPLLGNMFTSRTPENASIDPLADRPESFQSSTDLEYQTQESESEDGEDFQGEDE